MYKVIFSFIFSIIGLNMYSQTIEQLLIENNKDNITEKFLNTSSGLCSNAIRKIGQTDEGLLLIATYNGISLFDGQSFKNYSTLNLPILKSNNIVDLKTDTSGRFIIATGHGIIAYKNGFQDTKFSRYFEESRINCIEIDKSGKLWVGTSNFLCQIIDDTISKIKEFDVNKQGVPSLIFTDKNGKTWIGTLEGRLYKFTGNSFKLMLEGDNSSSFRTAVEDNESNIYFGTKSAVYQCKNESIKLLTDDMQLVNSLSIDEQNNLWITSSRGAYYYNNNSKIIKNISLKGNAKSITHIFVDNDHNMWLGTYFSGLIKISIGAFTNVEINSDSMKGVPTASIQLNNGTFWVGFNNGEVYQLVRGTYKKYNLKSDLRESLIKRMLYDSKHNKWLCTYNGLLKISPDGTETLVNSSNGFPDNAIRGIIENDNNTYWVATGKSGLILMDDNCKVLKQLHNKKYFDSNYIMDINKGVDSTILVASKEGVYIIKNAEVINHITTKNGFASNVVFHVYQDKSLTYWISSDNGVYAVIDDKIYQINVDEDFDHNPVFETIEDSYGYMWFTHKNGIVRTKKTDLIKYIKKEKKKILFTKFDNSDGIDGKYVSASKVLKTNNNKLLLHTSRGVNFINPYILNLINSNSNLVINKIITENKQYNKINELQKIIADTKYFEFIYDFIDFANFNKVEIYYKLSPFDYDYHKVESGEKIFYTNLPYDNYTFTIKAVVNSTKHKELTTSTSFIVQAPWYETALFKFIAIFIILIIIILIYYTRLRVITRQNNALEKEVLIRTNKINEQKKAIENHALNLEKQKKELQEANMAKDKMLSIIGHDLKGPLGSLKDLMGIIISGDDMSEETRNLFEIMHTSLGKTYSLLENLLLWARNQRNMIKCKIETFSIFDSVKNSVALVNELAANKNIEIIIDVNKSLQVKADENMITTIIRNIVSNSIKFTKEQGKIYIKISEGSLDEHASEIEVNIKDSGIGISKKMIQRLQNSNLEVVSTYGTNNEQGSGLGIGICIDFLKKHNKTLYIKNNKDIDGTQGSTFWFYLDKADNIV